MITSQQRVSLRLSQDGLKDSSKRFGELIVEVVFRVDGDVVLEDEDGIFRAFEVLCSRGAFDDHIGDTITESRCRACVSLLHSCGEFDVCLLGRVVVFGEGFGDDEFRHVNFVLKEVGDSVFDVAMGC